MHLDQEIVYLTIDGERIATTPEHPFFTQAYGWLPAGALWVGAQVRNAEGEYGTVEAVAVVRRPQPMYNLTVAQAHTFFVGDQQWLVHNDCTDLLDPNSIRFTQDSIGSTFKDGRSVQGLIDDLKAGRISADDVPPIRVFEKDGKLYTLDNRRLYAFQQTGVPIRTVRATAEEVVSEGWKFTTKNDGISIRVRGR